MKFRVHIWRSPSGARPDAFGIQGQHHKGRPYRHVCATVKGVHRALIYKTRARAEEVAEGLGRDDGKPVDTTTGLTPLVNRARRAS